MDDPKLREQLEQLQAEIRQSRSVDEEGKALLQDLDADIHALLARSEGEAVEVQPSTVERLQRFSDLLRGQSPLPDRIDIQTARNPQQRWNLEQTGCPSEELCYLRSKGIESGRLPFRKGPDDATESTKVA